MTSTTHDAIGGIILHTPPRIKSRLAKPQRPSRAWRAGAGATRASPQGKTAKRRAAVHHLMLCRRQCRRLCCHYPQWRPERAAADRPKRPAPLAARSRSCTRKRAKSHGVEALLRRAKVSDDLGEYSQLQRSLIRRGAHSGAAAFARGGDHQGQRHLEGLLVPHPHEVPAEVHARCTNQIIGQLGERRAESVGVDLQPSKLLEVTLHPAEESEGVLRRKCVLVHEDSAQMGKYAS